MLKKTFLQRYTKCTFSTWANANLDAAFAKASTMNSTQVTLQQMYDFGKTPSEKTFVNNCQFLHKEVPIRLAKMIVDLDNLPYGLTHAPNIRRVRSLHVEAFHKLKTIPSPKTFEEASSLTHLLKYILHSHNFVVPHLACAMFEMSENSFFQQMELSSCPYLTSFLDRYLTRRIGIRMLMAQQVSLLTQFLNPAIRQKHFVGEIDSKIVVKTILEEQIVKCQQLCKNKYGVAPEIIITDKQINTFKYIRGHLHLITFELLKNAVCAVCEFRDRPEEHPVHVIIADGPKDLAIKVCDEGGGISREASDKVWNWAYSTAKENDYEKLNRFLNEFHDGRKVQGLSKSQIDSIVANSIVGLGYGLPTARLYARYFGGDLQLFSMEAYGTDAFIYLKRNPDVSHIF